MLRVEPFRGFRFDPRRVSLSRALCPPYDVIAPKMADRLRRIAISTIHIELPKGKTDAKYARAAGVWKHWIRDGSIIRDETPAFYVLEQRFKLAGKPMRRVGILAALGLERASASRVIPHEKTLSKPKKDRMKLLAALGLNTSPIFAIYTDPKGAMRARLRSILSGRPEAAGTAPDGVELRLWKVSGAEATRAVSKALASKKLLIADGHHRFEVARKNGQRAILCYLCAEEDAGLAVLPTHRVLDEGAGVLAQARKLCRIAPAASLERMLSQLERQPSPFAFGIAARRKYSVAVPKPASGRDVRSRLGVEWLAKRLFRDVDPHLIRYTHDAAEAASWADGNGAVAIFVKSVGVADIRRAVARAGLLPQKSTYFFPKVEAGAVFRCAE